MKIYGGITYPGPTMPELLDCLVIGHEVYPHGVVREKDHPAYGWNNLACLHCREYWEWREPFLGAEASILDEDTPLTLTEYSD